jgi:hypothetical protein
VAARQVAVEPTGAVLHLMDLRAEGADPSAKHSYVLRLQRSNAAQLLLQRTRPLRLAGLIARAPDRRSNAFAQTLTHRHRQRLLLGASHSCHPA